MLKVMAFPTLDWIIASSPTHNHGSYGDVFVWIYFERAVGPKECAMNLFSSLRARTDFMSAFAKRGQVSVDVSYSSSYLTSSAIHGLCELAVGIIVNQEKVSAFYFYENDLHPGRTRKEGEVDKPFG